jgi:predicted amidophosphoribosyltransferase
MSFVATKPEIFKNKKILVIDDVFTTGKTANSVSKALKDCNADKVYVMVIASGE